MLKPLSFAPVIKQNASFSCLGRIRSCLCSLPIRCKSKSIGHISVIRTSKSISRDCSSTCVPTIIRASFRGIAKGPSSSKSAASSAALCSAKKRECISVTTPSPKASFNSRANACACLTVLTIMPAAPPSHKSVLSFSTISASSIKAVCTLVFLPANAIGSLLTLFASV